MSMTDYFLGFSGRKILHLQTIHSHGRSQHIIGMITQLTRKNRDENVEMDDGNEED